MPGFITHLCFGQQAIPFIEDKTAKSTIENHIQAFGLGLQGPDIFFYYLPAYLFHKKNIGNLMHSNNVMLFFDSMFTARNGFESAKERSVCDAYICGFMGHYTLDVWCHPYIYFRTDHFKALNERGGKYDFGRHVSLETDIDHDMLRHYKNCLPSEFDYAAQVLPVKEEVTIIAKLVKEALEISFPEEKIKEREVKGAIKAIARLNKKMHDPKGSKKKFVRKIEQGLWGYAFISAMIPSDTIIKCKDACNENHIEWENPWDESYKSTDSIYDRFKKSTPEYLERIKLYMESVDTSREIEENSANGNEIQQETEKYIGLRNKLLSNLSDLSYLSGFPLED